MYKTLIVAMFVASTVSAAPKPKKVYKVTPVSDAEIIVVCSNGADPTFKAVTSGAVLVSCGATVKATWDGTKFTCPASAPYVWADEGEALDHKSDYVYCGKTALLGQ
jgi:hypothetical protein